MSSMPELTPEVASQRLNVIDAAEPDTLRKLQAYELEEMRLQHLLSLNPPPGKREQLERILQSVQEELWEIRASASFLAQQRAQLQRLVAERGSARPAGNDS